LSAGCDSCGDDLASRQATTLWLVLAINAVMFVVEATAGVLARSTSLLADAGDMLGDTLAYSTSLYVLNRSAHGKAKAAMVKGAIMAVFGVVVFSEAAFKIQTGITPTAVTMGAVAALALVANVICFGLLFRHRGDDVNMRSVWLCSRNDVIANVAVMTAALGVWISNSFWPDLLVGVAIALLFFSSAFQVIREATQILNAPEPQGQAS
jgi:cation diffusion facilitator family transporter